MLPSLQFLYHIYICIHTNIHYVFWPQNMVYKYQLFYISFIQNSKSTIIHKFVLQFSNFNAQLIENKNNFFIN